MRKIILFVAVMMLLYSQNIKAQWTELGGLNGLAANGPIKTICTDPAGNIYAAGGFRNASGMFYVAKWDGSSWSELGGLNGIKANDTINAICSDLQGNIYAGGKFKNDAYSNSFVEKWDGSNWIVLDANSGFEYWNWVNSLSSDLAGNIYAVGDLWKEMTGPFLSIFNGNYWGNKLLLQYHPSYPVEMFSSCSDHLGNIYIAGQSAYCAFVTFYNGSQIGNFGPPPGYQQYGSKILSICSDTSGNLYAGGIFTNGSNLNNGYYYVAKGNGTTWTELGGKDALAANNPIRSVFRDALGRIFAGGDFTNSSGKNYVAKFDGMCWTELGGNNSLAANNSIRTICTDTAGNIYVAGDFTNANGKQYVAVLNKSLGLDELTTSQISISPNPTTGLVTISSPNAKKIEVMDVIGREMLCEPIETSNLGLGFLQSTFTIDVAQWSSGVYIVRWTNEDGHFTTGKFMKQ